jgi:hypothetical protein
VGNSCQYQVAIGDQTIAGDCNEGEVKDERGAGTSSGATLWLRSVSDYRAMPYDQFGLQMGTEGREIFWKDVEGLHWVQGAGDDRVSYINFYFSRDAEKPGIPPTPDTHADFPALSVSCGVRLEMAGTNVHAFDFEINSVEEVCRLADEGFFLVHGSLRATCDVQRDGASTKELADIRVTF